MNIDKILTGSIYFDEQVIVYKALFISQILIVIGTVIEGV